jgi:hypothetical protein
MHLNIKSLFALADILALCLCGAAGAQPASNENERQYEKRLLSTKTFDDYWKLHPEIDKSDRFVTTAADVFYKEFSELPLLGLEITTNPELRDLLLSGNAPQPLSSKTAMISIQCERRIEMQMAQPSYPTSSEVSATFDLCRKDAKKVWDTLKQHPGAEAIKRLGGGTAAELDTSFKPPTGWDSKFYRLSDNTEFALVPMVVVSHGVFHMSLAAVYDTKRNVIAVAGVRFADSCRPVKPNPQMPPYYVYPICRDPEAVIKRMLTSLMSKLDMAWFQESRK